MASKNYAEPRDPPNQRIGNLDQANTRREEFHAVTGGVL